MRLLLSAALLVLAASTAQAADLRVLLGQATRPA